MNKILPEQKVGLELGKCKDSSMLIITKIHQGSLADQHSELRPGAKLLDIMANGIVHRGPDVQQAAQLIADANGELQLTVMPLLDRYGFVVDVQVRPSIEAHLALRHPALWICVGLLDKDGGPGDGPS